MRGGRYALLLVVCLGWSTSTLAQDAAAEPSAETETVSEEAPLSDAGEAFVAGQVAFGEEDYETALRLFQRSYELSPHANTLFNSGWCYEMLDRPTEAFRIYHAIVNDPEAADVAKQRAVERRDRLQSQVSLIVVRPRSDESIEARLEGAEEFLDLPEQWAVEPGPVTFELRSGERSWTRSIDATFGNVVYLEVEALRLEVPPESVAIEVSPPVERRTFEAGPMTWVGGALTLVGVGGSVAAWTIGGTLHDDFVANGRICSGSTCAAGQATNVLTWVGVGVAVIGATMVLLDLLVVDH